VAKVDFFHNAADTQAALLGSLGFSTSYIQARTGLTQCQVLYRLGKATIRRSDYRDGQSPLAQKVFGHVKFLAEVSIKSKLEKAMRAELDRPTVKIRKRA
jgi:hypothetical protein